MKTNILKLISIGLLASSMLTGCAESFLDEKNPNKLTEDTYWKTIDDAVAALPTLYSPIRGQMYGYFGAMTGFQNMNVRGDDMHAIHDDPETWQITDFTNTPSTNRYDWDRMYTGAHRANVFLLDIDRATIAEDKKKELVAEARFLRAFNYYLLVTSFGEVPLRTDPVKEPANVPMPSSPATDVWKLIEEDLKFAKEYLPMYLPGGRATRGAAIAYLGKAYAEQHKYAEAKAELDIIMTSPYTYDLVEDYQDNFRPHYLKASYDASGIRTDEPVSVEFNKESIFELNYDKFGSGSWGDEGDNDTQGMVLPQFIGTPLTGGWFKLLPAAYIIGEYIKEERPAGSDSRFDKRMYTNFYFKYSDYNDTKKDEVWYGEEPQKGKEKEDKRVGMDDLWKSTEGKRKGNQPVYPTINGKEGRFLPKKFTAFWSTKKEGDSMYSSTPIDNNYRVLRFAEILLLHAEACAKTGNYADAAKDLKRIRKRAGLEDKTLPADEIGLMKEIEHQSLLEFWFEGHRFYNLKRWNDYAKIKDTFIKNKKQGANNFEKKHLVYPIPQSELDMNKSIQPHPLWR